MLQFFIGGTISGAVLAILAVALVLTYKTSHVFNFALPGMAYFGAFVYYELAVVAGIPVVLSAIIAVIGVGGGMGLLLYLALFRFLEGNSATLRLTVTIGLQVALVGLAQLCFGSQEINNDIGLFHGTPPSVTVGGVVINGNQLAALIVAALVAVTLPAILRWTNAGLKLRAVVDNPEASRRFGIRVHFASASSWFVASALTVLAGILIAPIVNLDPSAYSNEIVAAFAGALLARLTSLSIAFLGALLTGLAQGLMTNYLPATGVIGQGLEPSLPFLLIVAVVIIYTFVGNTEDLKLEATAVTKKVPLARPPNGGLLRWPILLIGLAVVVPFVLSDFWTGQFGASIALAIIFLSWKLVTGEGGMVSLAQITLAGIGAVATAQFATVHGLDVALSMLLGALVAGIIGTVVGMLALQLNTVYAAVMTFAFALFFDNMIFPTTQFDPYQEGVALARPSIGPIAFTSNRAYYYLALAVFVAIAALLRNLRWSDSGLVLATVRSSTVRSRTFGVGVVTTKIFIYAAAGVIAGLGGCIYASYQLAAEPLAFSSGAGLLWFAVFMLWGASSTGGCIITGLSLVALTEFIGIHTSTAVQQILPIGFGLGVIGLARHPEGVAIQNKEMAAKLVARLRHTGHPLPIPAAASAGQGPTDYAYAAKDEGA